MSVSVLVIGESGTGKSTSIRTLNPADTYLINVIDKPLPFRNRYRKTVKNDKDETIIGNMFSSDSPELIRKAILHVNEKRLDIKNVVIDDFQYIMANEFMERALEKGFDKFTQIQKNSWDIIRLLSMCRHDLTFYLLSHSQQGDDGISRTKTIGKLLDEKITFEGLFTIVMHTIHQDGKYSFLTQMDGRHLAKSPLDMFADKLIPNDLGYVKKTIDEFYKEDINQ